MYFFQWFDAFPFNHTRVFQLFLQNIGVVAVAASVIPVMLIPILPLLLFFLYLRRFYLRISRDVKRLEATSNFRLFLSHAISFLVKKAPVKAPGLLLLMLISCLSCSKESHLLSPVFIYSGLVDHPSLPSTGKTAGRV